MKLCSSNLSNAFSNKPHPVPNFYAQQTSLHMPLSSTANLALYSSKPCLCSTVRHSQLRPVPHCQAQQA